jgi:hypothetical protein
VLEPGHQQQIRDEVKGVGNAGEVNAYLGFYCLYGIIFVCVLEMM